jgi:hypothetical protein
MQHAHLWNVLCTYRRYGHTRAADHLLINAFSSSRAIVLNTPWVASSQRIARQQRLLTLVLEGDIIDDAIGSVICHKLKVECQGPNL